MHGRRAMVHRRSSGEVRPYVRSSKPRFNWTGELKLLFEEAMALLGGTRKATPKQIRELMKCPHIQLSHIKSRLQMCRIRLEEKERRPESIIFAGTNSSEELQRKTRETAAYNNDAASNGDERSVVVDESEPNNAAAALSLSIPSSSLEYQHSQRHFFFPSPQSDLQPPSKRLRVDQVNPSASSWQSPQRICDAGAIKFQFCFDYFGPSQEYGAVMPVLSNADIFREEQSENREEAKEEEELQLSLSMPCRAKMINLDLSMSFPES